MKNYTNDLENYLDKQTKKLKQVLNSKGIAVNYQFLGDTTVTKEGKPIGKVARNDYLKLAQKIKEFHDYCKALEMDK